MIQCFLVVALLILVEDQPEHVLPANLRAVVTRYQLDVVVSDPGFPVRATYGQIDGKTADPRRLSAYAELFAREFGLYPVELVRRTRLKRVVLCDDLTFAGQRRNAIPDWEHETLYLDVSRGSYNETYLRKVIHHEFFHLIDYSDDGLVYGDQAWIALNFASFRYGAGGRTAQAVGPTSILSDATPGFLNHYSTLGVEEDKAEVFANLIVDPAYVASRAAQDPVIAAKVRRIKALLNEFAPSVDGSFWPKVAPTRRDGD